MAETDGTFLTARQAQVMRLRSEGRTLAEVASQLGTSKQNVHALERTAVSNVERARATLAFFRRLTLPVVVEARPGEDIADIIGRLLAAADEAGIRVLHNRVTLAHAIYEPMHERFRCTRAAAPFEVGVTREGEVLVGPSVGEGEAVGAHGRGRRRQGRRA